MEITEILENSEINASSRLGSCEVCKDPAAKYSCPRCELKTCSLKCSKIHKTELDCNGVRDRTKYKPLKQMTSMDFMNDYYFLEEATRFTKEIKSNKVVKAGQWVPPKAVRLKRAAFERKIRLFFLNNALSKRKGNSSHISRENEIFWQVECNFPNADGLKIHQKFNENTKIHDIVESLLNSDENELNFKKLEFYRAEGVARLRVLLKAEGLKNCNHRFHEMDVKKSLKSNLKGKVLIEYPALVVVMNHSADGFEIVESDDELIESEIKTYTATLRDEIFSKKIGVNPPLEVHPEEVPIISEVLNEPKPREKKFDAKIEVKTKKIPEPDSDGEIQPSNYFFNNDDQDMES